MPALPPIKLFMDCADLALMRRAHARPEIAGFTTNPTLMRKAGITDYAGFAKAAVAALPGKPISLEVFADSPAEMEREALAIHGWGEGIYVKVPITNTTGTSTAPLLRRLSARGVALNVTAITTLEQVAVATEALHPDSRGIVSVFAGRVADTGEDPEPLMRSAVALLRGKPRAELLWASPRELFNLFQAARVGCHIITATPDILAKLPLVGKDLAQVSRETVRMFHADAREAGFVI